MTFDEFTDELYRLGWRANCDAQHTEIRSLWLQIQADYGYRAKWAVLDEKVNAVRSAVDAAKAENWQHIPVSVVSALVGAS